jgi:hypothetical protein
MNTIQALRAATYTKRRYVAFAVLGSVVLFATAFVFLFVHQVRVQRKFLITVSKFGAMPMPHVEHSWFVHIEQLSYEKLENVQVLIDQGTIHNSAMPFAWSFNNETIDGRAQKEFGISPHPSTITMVWDGGSETFRFNATPIP